VQVHHDEGVANRIDPGSCADAREGIGEALTGERIGQPLSRESTLILGADVVPVTEGNTDGRDNASAQTARRGLDTGMCARSCSGTGRSHGRPAVRRVGECAMIYTLTVILLLVGAAASAIMVIAMWGVGVPVLRRWRRRQRAS